MHTTRPIRHFLATAFCAIVLGCAASSDTRPHHAVQLGETVRMNAESYGFEPSTIIMDRPGKLAIAVTNVSEGAHNLTIKGPEGDILASKDLPPGSERNLVVELDEPGLYEFYCNKPFHPSLGMTGEIQVKPER